MYQINEKNVKLLDELLAQENHLLNIADQFQKEIEEEIKKIEEGLAKLRELLSE